MRRRQPTPVLQEAMAHFEVVADYGAGGLSDQKTIDAIVRSTVDRDLPVMVEAVGVAIVRSS